MLQHEEKMGYNNAMKTLKKMFTLKRVMKGFIIIASILLIISSFAPFFL